jgi:two-component system chemotaxis response regulator CheY
MAKRILIADDLSFIRMLQKEVLTEDGYQIVGEAANGREAVEKYRDLAPDVVILDITMPGMNGLAALQEILAIDPGARVLICSSVGQQSVIVEAIQAGARDFVVKPFKPERLAAAIARALADGQ